MFRYRYRRIYSLSSFKENDDSCWHVIPTSLVAIQEPNDVGGGTADGVADGVIRFTKSREWLPSLTNFIKKIYLKRDGEIIEEKICYNTHVYIKSKDELLKLLKTVSGRRNVNINSDDFHYEKNLNQENECSNFIKAHLCNVISIARTDSIATDIFIINNVSWGVYQHSTKINKFEETHPKISLVKSFTRSKDEKSIGYISIEFKQQNTIDNCKFVVMIQIIKRQQCVKYSVKERLKTCLIDCSQEIRRYNLPLPKFIGQLIRQNNMEELLKLNLYNWKSLGLQFVSSKDESFYKQIRRKNKQLPEI